MMDDSPPSMHTQQEQQRILLRKLEQGIGFDHAADAIEVIETHISHVVLAGPYAYKIKKALQLDFLDYSTPELRRICCEEELRLNKRYAPALYLDLVTITGTPEQPRVVSGGQGFEYAVRMRRFDAPNLFSAMADAGKLTSAHVEALAGSMASFHADVADGRCPQGYGTSERVLAPMLDNFEQLKSLSASGLQARLRRLERWTQREVGRHRTLIEARLARGFVRECHGDLHLGNVALVDGKATLFDGIEFDAELRWIDTVNEVAFVLMDLEARGLRPLAAALLNRYLELTGDYSGMHLLTMYKVYRALVRAKIAAIRAKQNGISECDEVARYVALAERYMQPQAPQLFLMHGLSGSGKSYVARRMAAKLGGVRLSSDRERRRMPPQRISRGHAANHVGYDESEREAVYLRLAEISETLIPTGYPVVIDATFLLYRYRRLFYYVARRTGSALHIVDVRADDDLRETLLRRRAAANDSLSEANATVVQQQRRIAEPLTSNELQTTTVVNNRLNVEPDLQLHA